MAVTAGGGKGIGLACASCLGHEGCKVVVADIDDTAASRCKQLWLEFILSASMYVGRTLQTMYTICFFREIKTLTMESMLTVHEACVRRSCMGCGPAAARQFPHTCVRAQCGDAAAAGRHCGMCRQVRCD